MKTFANYHEQEQNRNEFVRYRSVDASNKPIVVVMLIALFKKKFDEPTNTHSSTTPLIQTRAKDLIEYGTIDEDQIQVRTIKIDFLTSRYPLTTNDSSFFCFFNLIGIVRL